MTAADSEDRPDRAPTRLDDLVARFNTVQQAQFYVEHLGADFSDYLDERRALSGGGRSEPRALCAPSAACSALTAAISPNFIFGADDIVAVLGQDGLVANTLKYLDGQHVLGINPDPARWNGVLLPFVPRRSRPHHARRDRAAGAR